MKVYFDYPINIYNTELKRQCIDITNTQIQNVTIINMNKITYNI